MSYGGIRASVKGFSDEVDTGEESFDDEVDGDGSDLSEQIFEDFEGAYVEDMMIEEEEILLLRATMMKVLRMTSNNDVIVRKNTLSNSDGWQSLLYRFACGS
ncbi:hypothetical protein JTB14_027007 [Gonioctena quinquepunctata]|nr:hypothetical protein JTB14_027007 [Gonioctena quinquepunctata]